MAAYPAAIKTLAPSCHGFRFFLLVYISQEADLINRIRKHQTSTDDRAPTEDPAVQHLSISDETHCLIAASIPLDAADTIEMAREELENAAKNDHLHEEYLSAGTVVTNTRGRFWTSMDSQMSEFREELARTTVRLDAKTDELQRATARLEMKTNELERTAVGFRDFRHRFISTYKRDILNQSDVTDKNFIQHGNNIVHSGNVKRDAELYTGPYPRHDISVFRKLYGVLPVVATTIEYEPTISVLDRYATIVSNPKKEYTGRYLDTHEEPEVQYWSVPASVPTQYFAAELQRVKDAVENDNTPATTIYSAAQCEDDIAALVYAELHLYGDDGKKKASVGPPAVVV
ncbi:uncharacterized protein TRUGW13939_03983 [Talaromyces rugulosus]|uniref:Uncharacterized protein n=1 Tax=Talaromyces rugulosus TaxID=121627 RepID=A0A7H8QSV7_TALRU|nr:uncharacterized protein TRUGW13939_03983 [Talaromyces rugulosus]QKX56876.1 hypothetical protein TRUGW13939_03983 [Talaromyces rugulosus]